MNQSNLDKLLIQNNEGINNAVKTVSNFQKGKINPIQTSYWFLNMICLGGLLPDLIISILGRPGHGKSFIAHILRNDTLYFSTEPLTPRLDQKIGGHSFCY